MPLSMRRMSTIVKTYIHAADVRFAFSIIRANGACGGRTNAFSITFTDKPR